ncbi:MAG: peptidase [Oscillospiraceae bacterium]|nr:peptidase [Oscillospiraceae bacterium]
MNKNFRRGVSIVVDKWMQVRPGESMLIITDLQHHDEMKEVSKYAQALGANIQIRVVPGEYSQDLSPYFDELAVLMQNHSIIIGATHYSLVTTEVVKQAVRSGSRFLSLPMATNDGRSILEYKFLTMNTDKARFMAKMLLKYINESTYIHLKTRSGTDLRFRKIGRKGSYFNGRAKDNKGFTSSSFEVYVAVEEDQSSGVGIVDGSLGYLGKVQTPFSIRLDSGRIVDIEQNEFGMALDEYLKSFSDERIYNVSEFGIGLNTYSKCDGRCYIEDESAYGTAHIGFGRNHALGGEFEANGHFDIVFREPSIYADNRVIMEDGVIVVAEPDIW